MTPERKKEFVRLFDGMTGAHSRPELWRDMIPLFALCIAQSVQWRKDREERYLGIVRRYDEKCLSAFSQLLGLLTVILEEGIRAENFGDPLGELFMEMQLGSAFGGQFFTPYHVALMMARLLMDAEQVRRQIAETGRATLYEPACGAGATLIAAAQALREQGIDYQRQCVFYAQEIDEATAMMCYIQLSLLGAPAVVRVGNTLTDPEMRVDKNAWCTPMYLLGGAKWPI